MIYVATTTSGVRQNLGPAYSVQVNKSREAPADSLTAVFFSKENHLEYKTIEVYAEEASQLFFDGVVDEQKFEVTATGCFLTIKSRSKAAVLIDNEATPQTYKRPSLDIIFSRHIKPYGFSAINGDNSSFNATIEVEKGMSEWDVLELFCSVCLNSFPIVNADGTIDIASDTGANSLMFSNFYSGGVNYSAISQKYSRYKLISEITVCEQYSAIYAATIRDQGLIDKGISRRKFISMSEDAITGISDKKVSIKTAEQMLENAKKKFCEITVKCPNAVQAKIGTRCQINDDILGRIEGLKIYEVEYKLSRTGEFTTITLLKE